MPPIKSARFLASAAALVLASTAVGRADVKMPAIFGDHMVLQRDRAVPVWGWASPDEKITVTIDTQTQAATADHSGNWSLKLDSLKLSDQPTTMTVAGTNTITVNDVLVGDVWICAGQSNMGFPLNGVDDAAAVIKQSADDQLRLFAVDATLNFDVQKDCKGTWTKCSPASVPGFTAVGYFFGRALRAHLKIPIGLIETSLGGTSVQSWTSREGLEKTPEGKVMLAKFDRDIDKLKAQTDTYNNVTVPKWHEDDQAWRKEVQPAYLAEMKKWNDAVAAAKTSGETPPPRPMPSKPHPSIGAPPNRMTPIVLYNAMAAPIIPFAVKGFTFYQGENNTFEPAPYGGLFKGMIEDWRSRWGEGDVPFLFVQIANYRPTPTNAMAPGKWAFLREGQVQGLKEPNTAMTISVDVGNPDDVHYHNKLPVGERLAMAARHLAYGEDVVGSGPIFKSMEPQGDRVRVTFSEIGSGLMTAAPPAKGSAFGTATDGPLKDFEIAGSDNKFVPAEATIDGDAVIVHAKDVPQPTNVRYGFVDNPQGNLYNKEGFPASPFRTDTLPPPR